MNAYVDAMHRYFDFKGRSSRAEFWCFTLVTFVGTFVAMIFDLAIGNDESGVMFFSALWVIPHYIPALAISVRRLHDIDRTGWWNLIGVIPLGAIVLLVFYCRPSTPGANRFGSGVTGDSAAPSAIQAQPQTNTATAATNLDHLERLAALRASGAINETEFRQMKALTIAAVRS